MNFNEQSLNKRVDQIMREKGYPEKGWAFCVHHNILIEYCTSFRERVAAILETKPQSEHEARFTNFTFVDKKLLPKNGFAAWVKANAAQVKAYAAWRKANAAQVKAYAAWRKANAAQVKAYAAWVKANAAQVKAYAAQVKAYAAYIAKNNDKLISLFKKLAPSNTWNGKNIGWE